MGAFESSEEYELSPPPPSRSTLFVVRNGRYEPQNLMPVLPRPDMLDFDGFVVRRGGGQGRLNVNPPQMRQENLLKNPLSVRKDSVRVGPLGGGDRGDVVGASEEVTAGCAGDEKLPITEQNDRGETSSNGPEASAASGNDYRPPVISFVFDALAAGNLTVQLMVREVEVRLSEETPPDEMAEAETVKTEEAKPNARVAGPSYIKLVSQEVKAGDDEPEENAEDLAFLLTPEPPAAPQELRLDSRRIEAGLGQLYESPPVDLQRWSAAQLAFDPSRPKDIPIAVRLEADVEPGEEPSIQYTYISLHCDGEEHGTWSAQQYLQKLQYGNTCFVLREVFGVTSKFADDAETAEAGNSDCVICLSEPRDTAVLPCRHMCFCSYCAGIVRLQCDRCPVCRQKVQSLLQFKRDENGQGVGENATTDGLTPGPQGAAASAASTASSAAAAASTTALSGSASAESAQSSSVPMVAAATAS